MKRIIVGIDEVGRGPLAGPVTVGACVLLDLKKILMNAPAPLRDSKQLSKAQREVWCVYLKQCSKNGWCSFAVSSVSSAQIDRIGIAPAIRRALTSSLNKLALDSSTCKVFLDGGLKAPAQYRYQQTIIKGDSLVPAISLASIVAKVHRDRYMYRMARRYPVYGFDRHVGYGTSAHRAILRIHGTSPIHRVSFLRNIV